VDGERFRTLRAVLVERWGAHVAVHFEQAWHSQSLSECPSLAEWQALVSASGAAELQSRAAELERLGDLDAALAMVNAAEAAAAPGALKDELAVMVRALAEKRDRFAPWKCPRCGASVEAGALACPACGYARGSAAWRSRYNLLPHDAVHGLSQRVAYIWRLGSQPAARGERLQLGERVLHMATAVALGSEQEARTLLVRAGASVKAASALAETLGSPVSNGMLIAFALDGSQRRATGLGFLEGRNGLWRLRAHTDPGDTRVDVVPCGAPDLKHDLRWFFSQTLPSR
jgi:hypothetical protein